jgi:hypothetical protein
MTEHRRSLALAALVAAAPAAAFAQRPQPIEVRAVRSSPVLGPLEYQTGSSLVWLSDATLAIVDGTDHQVVVFDTTGREVARLGRTGRGPGEFASGGPLLAGARGAIVAGDILTSRVSWFDAQRRFVKSVQLPGLPMNLLDWSRDRVVVVWTIPGGSPTVGSVDLAAGTAAPLFAVYRADSALGAPISIAGMSMPPPFLASAAAPGGLYLFARGDQYRVVAFDSSGLVRRSFGRPELRPQFRTPDERRAQEERLDRAMQRMGVTPPPEAAQMLRDARRQLLDQPKPFLSSGLAVDQAGRVWVPTPRGISDSTEVDVFAPSGTFLQTVVLPHVVVALAFRGPRLAVLAQYRGGELDEQSEVSLYVVGGGEGVPTAAPRR